MLTRGQTDRLSAESMLNYFQPLLPWLKVQNREESIVGWNTNMEDTALFQPLHSSGVFVHISSSVTFVVLLKVLV